MAMGYIGLYTGLYLVSKMLPKSAAPPTAPVVASSGDMPSADSAEFGEWIGQEGNLEKLFSA